MGETSWTALAPGAYRDEATRIEIRKLPGSGRWAGYIPLPGTSRNDMIVRPTFAQAKADAIASLKRQIADAWVAAHLEGAVPVVAPQLAEPSGPGHWRRISSGAYVNDLLGVKVLQEGEADNERALYWQVYREGVAVPGSRHSTLTLAKAAAIGTVPLNDLRQGAQDALRKVRASSIHGVPQGAIDGIVAQVARDLGVEL